VDGGRPPANSAKAFKQADQHPTCFLIMSCDIQMVAALHYHFRFNKFRISTYILQKLNGLQKTEYQKCNQ